MNQRPPSMSPDRLKEEDILDRTVSSSARRRAQLEREQAAFFAAGGQVQEIPTGLSGIDYAKTREPGAHIRQQSRAAFASGSAGERPPATTGDWNHPANKAASYRLHQAEKQAKARAKTRGRKAATLP